MKIPPDSQPPVDPTPRSRPGSPAAAPLTTPTGSSGTTGDSADVGATPTEIGRYVQILKSMSPFDSTKVDSLKARIKDGSYQASASELSGPLTDLLDPPSAPASGSQPG